MFPLIAVAAHSGSAVGIPNGKFLTVGNPAINDWDDVAFQAVISGSGITAANNSGIWVKTNASVEPIVCTGSVSDYLSGTTPQTGVFTALSDPVLNNNDQAAFLGSMKTGSGRSAVTVQGIYLTGTDGGLVQTAQVGSQELAMQTGTSTAAIASFTQYVLTDQGSIAFLASLKTAPGSVTASNNLGIWTVDQKGQSHLVARTGFPLATTPGSASNVTALSIFAAPTGVGGQARSFNAKGELMFAATFANHAQGIFAVDSSYAISMVSVTSDPAPSTSGTFVTFSSPIINGTGNAAFQAVIAGGGIAAGNNSGIWAESGTARNLELVARLGESSTYSAVTASGTQTISGVFTALGNPVSNAGDQVAFIGTVKIGTGRTAASSQGIWVAGTAASGLSLVTQAQNPAPYCAIGAKFSSFAELVLPDQGGAVFVANLAATGVTTANNQGLWAVGTNGQLNLVARKGDVLVVDSNNDLKTVASLSIFSTSTATAGQTRSFNNAGDLVYKVTFTDGTQSLYQVVFPD
jgi:hypothetical protein